MSRLMRDVSGVTYVVNPDTLPSARGPLLTQGPFALGRARGVPLPSLHEAGDRDPPRMVAVKS